MSKDNTIWDYSQVPPRVWKWYFDQEDGDNWMEVHITPSGLTYIGTDWTVQSGGEYFGGFQTFDEFFRDGPIQKMPEHIAAELRKHLLAHRMGDGATLRLLLVGQVDGLVLQGVYVHLDDTPLTISIDETLAKKPEFLIFDGSIGVGGHKVSWVLVYRTKQEGEDQVLKVQGEVAFGIQPGEQTILLKTVLEKDGNIRIHFCQ
jgi:hypothetical protein